MQILSEQQQNLYDDIVLPMNQLVQPCRIYINLSLVLFGNYGRFVPLAFRTQDDSYPGWTIRTQWFGRFVPKVWTIRTQCFCFNFRYLIWYFSIQNCKIYSACLVLVDSYPFFVHFPYLIWSFLHVFIHQCVNFLVSPTANPTK